MTSLATWLSVRGIAPLVIPPLYIAVVSAVERRWGPSWSGRLTAIPTQTTTVILLVALTQGADLAGAVAAGALLGVMSLSAFAVVYGALSLRAAWKGSIVAALAAFMVVGLALVRWHGNPGTDAVAAVAFVAGAIAFLRRLPAPAPTGRRRRIGLLVRMALATVLVLAVAVSVPFLGPIAAGTLGVFPIITAPMTVLNHREAGAGASRRYLEGLEWGLLAGIVFFLLLSVLLSPWGIALAFATALPFLAAALLAGFLLPERLLRSRSPDAGSAPGSGPCEGGSGPDPPEGHPADDARP